MNEVDFITKERLETHQQRSGVLQELCQNLVPSFMSKPGTSTDEEDHYTSRLFEIKCFNNFPVCNTNTQL